MIKIGLCSITLAKHSVEEVVSLAKRTELACVEWNAKCHVKPGDYEQALYVKKLSKEAGLEIVSYGSYYRVGSTDVNQTSFSKVLLTAEVLETRSIRVWAGTKNYEDSSQEEIASIVEDTLKIAEMAAEKKIAICFEFHDGTLTNNNYSALKFSNLVVHPNVFFSWQPPHGYKTSYALQGLKELLPRLYTVHIYHWTVGSKDKNKVNGTVRELIYPDDYHRHPLSQGESDLDLYLKCLLNEGKEIPILIEFVKGDCPEQFIEDALFLSHLVKNISIDLSHIR